MMMEQEAKSKPIQKRKTKQKEDRKSARTSERHRCRFLPWLLSRKCHRWTHRWILRHCHGAVLQQLPLPVLALLQVVPRYWRARWQIAASWPCSWEGLPAPSHPPGKRKPLPWAAPSLRGKVEWRTPVRRKRASAMAPRSGGTNEGEAPTPVRAQVSVSQG